VTTIAEYFEQPIAKTKKPMSRPKTLARDPATSAEQLRSLRVVYDPQLDRLMARHPQTPPDLLETLSHSADRATRRHVARHPGTPKEVLLRLAPQFPGDFLHNPVVDWLLIEEPDLLQTLGKGVVKNVLKSTDCPESLMSWAVRHGTREEKLGVTMNPSATPQVLQALSSIKGSVGNAARAHVRHPKPFRIAAGISRLFVKEIRAGLAAMEADSAISDWRCGLLGPPQWTSLNPESRAAVLCLSFPLAAGREPDSGGCRELAKSTKATVAILTHLAKHPDGDVREKVAGNPSTPATLLDSLAKDPGWQVRYAAIGNPNASTTLLASFAIDPSRHLRSKVARNPSTPATLLASLAIDPDSDVRKAVAGNPSTPATLIETLAKDPDMWVRHAANQSPRSTPVMAPPRQIEATHPAGITAASDPTSSPDMLAKLARRRSLALRWALAANPSTPEAVRTDLVLSLVLKVGFEGLPLAAQKAATALRGQVHLILDSRHWWHRLQLLAHRYGYPRLPARLSDMDLVERFQREVQVFQGGPQASLTAEVIGAAKCKPFHLNAASIDKALKGPLHRLNDSGELLLVGLPKLFALAHANAPVDALVKAYRSVEWLERMAVARNLNAPPKLLVTLKKDANRFVSRQAVETENLQRQLQEWPALAMTVDDCWQISIAGVSQGVLNWDGFDGETTEQQEQLNLHRQALEALAANVFPSTASLDRVTSEIVTRLRHEGTIHYMWSDPAWVSLANIGDLWAWLCRKDQVKDELLERLHRGLSETQWLRMWKLGADLPSASIKAWIAGHSACPIEILTILAHDDNPKILIPLANNTNTPRALRSVVLRGLSAKEGAARQLIAEDSQAPAQILEALSRCPEVSVRRAVAVNPATPPICLRSLAKDSDVDLRRLIARSRAVSCEALDILSGDTELEVRLGVVANPNTTATLLTLLSRDQDVEVRRAVAGNSNTPPEVLEVLSHDQDVEVRRAVAGNSNTRPNSLEVMSQDPDEVIRHRIAGNSNTPPDALEVLSRHPDYGVRSSVAKNPGASLSVLESLSRDTEEWVREAVIENPHVPPDLVTNLYKVMDKNRHGSVRHQLPFASHPATPPEFLDNLAKSWWVGIRSAVAANPAMPASVVQALSKDPKPEVREQIAARPDIPVPVIDVLAEDKCTPVRLRIAQRDSLSPKLVTRLAMDKDAAVRLAMTRNPAAAPELVQKLMDILAEDKDQRTRIAIARHPAASLALLRSLANDDEKDVRRSAIERLSVETGGHGEGAAGLAVDLTRAMQSALERADLSASDQSRFSSDLMPVDLLRSLYWLNLIPQQPGKRFLSRTLSSPDWLTRLAMAIHPKASSAQRKRLSQDFDPDVAAAARLSLATDPISS
jgi:hypothetical protein